MMKLPMFRSSNFPLSHYTLPLLISQRGAMILSTLLFLLTLLLYCTRQRGNSSEAYTYREMTPRMSLRVYYTMELGPFARAFSGVGGYLPCCCHQNFLVGKKWQASMDGASDLTPDRSVYYYLELFEHIMAASCCHYVARNPHCFIQSVICHFNLTFGVSPCANQPSSPPDITPNSDPAHRNYTVVIGFVMMLVRRRPSGLTANLRNPFRTASKG